MLDSQQLENKINTIILSSQLTKETNPFFLLASKYQRNNKEITIPVGFTIANHWEILTKTFMFTTFQSLSRLSEEMTTMDKIPDNLLMAFQTGIGVINDDLNNNHPAFHAVAPSGAKGIHYKWWHHDIVKPLKDLSPTTSCAIAPGTQALLAGMKELANNKLGFAIQLRVVEAIALDIAVSFRSIFENISQNNQSLFSRKELNWIIAHIKAEITHHQQVANDNDGIAFLATSAKDQLEFISTLQWYANLWTVALDDFNTFLNRNNH